MLRRKVATRRRERARGIGSVLALGGALLLLAAAVAATSPPGYPFALTGDPVRVLRWPAGRPIQVFLAIEDPAAAPARRLARAFRAAADEWEAAAAGPVRFATTRRLADADVVVAWADSRLPVDTRGCEPLPARVAVTTFCATSDWTGLRPFPLRAPRAHAPSSVRMVVTLRPSAARTVERTRQLLAHELGHVLGLARHSPTPADLMWGGRLRALAPTRADRAALRALYAAEPDIVPGTPEPPLAR